MTETNRIEFKRDLTRVFRDVEMVESLGSGMNRIMRTYGRENFEFGDNFIRFKVFYGVMGNDTKNDTGNVIENNLQLTDRQVKILHRLVDTSKEGVIVNDTINDTINDTENAVTLSAYFNVSIITIKRDLSVLQKLGYIRHDGPNKGGRWLILKTEK